MNILYDSQIFEEQRYGGISRYFYEVIRGVAPLASIFLHDGVNVNEYGLDSLVSYKKRWGYHIRQFRGRRHFISRVNAIHLKYFIRNEKIDIYHPTYYKDYTVRGAKKVVTVYDMIHELFPENFMRDGTAGAKARILEKAAGIIAISENTKKDLIRILGIPENKIRVIYLANSLLESEQSAPLVQEPYILYVGNRSGYKNFLGLAKAYAASKYKEDVRLVCFGGGVFGQNEQDALTKLGIWNRVAHYSGNDAVLSNLYQFAEAFVYPSMYEGFGLPLLEAMHYGTPVLTGNTSSIPEVAGDAAAYFDPNEPESICEIMDGVLSDTDRRKDLQVRGRNREKLFSWQRCADETLAFYRSLV